METAAPAADGAAPRPGRASDRLGDRLAAMIFAGELRGGERLPPERELVQRFGVGRGVVREAITGLARRGLLLARPGHRPVVRRPSYDVAMESLGGVVGHLLRDEGGAVALFESRVFLEAALARHAALHASRADLEDLRAALERNRAAIGDAGEFYLTDVAFHGVLFRIPGNPIFPAVHKAYVAWLMSHWATMGRAADLDRLNHAGHAAILAAIAARDPDAAEDAMRRHLRVAWEHVRGTFLPAVAGRQGGASGASGA